MTDKKQRILVIEDDIPILEATTIKLEEEGFKVEQAVDGIIGLEYLKKRGPFDAILLDLRMPKGDGFKFLEDKAKDPSISGVPVVVFTNLGQVDYLNRSLGLGVKGYLIKAHHSLSEIIEEVKKCLKGEPCQIDR